MTDGDVEKREADGAEMRSETGWKGEPPGVRDGEEEQEGSRFAVCTHQGWNGNTQTAFSI